MLNLRNKRNDSDMTDNPFEICICCGCVTDIRKICQLNYVSGIFSDVVSFVRAVILSCTAQNHHKPIRRHHKEMKE